MEKICVKTFGCSLNQADSDRIIANLLERGFIIVDNTDDAELVILNSCAVKGPTESKFFTLIDKLKKDGKKLVVAGCISQAMPEKLEDCSKIGTSQLDSISDVVDETLNGNIVSVLVKENKNKILMPSKRQNPLVEIIPISSGCLNNCTYCITKLARGGLYSYPIEDIVARAKKAISEGVKEIFLTSPDNGCYGFDFIDNKDRKINLSTLVRKVAELDGHFYIRIGMANPNHIMKIIDEFIDVLKLDKVYKFAHIPVQSGDNFVLEDMKREYSIEDYYYIVNKIKKAIPDITIATDIIVGYPTESEVAYQNTLTMIKDTKPNVANISRFWPRPHTPAAELKEIPGGEVKDRTITIKRSFEWESRRENQKWIGWEGVVLVTEEGKMGSFISRNMSYKPVIIIVDKVFVQVGEKYKVKVYEVTEHYLRAKLVE